MDLLKEIEAHLPEDPKKDFVSDKLLRLALEHLYLLGWHPMTKEWPAHVDIHNPVPQGAEWNTVIDAQRDFPDRPFKVIVWPKVKK